MSAKEEIDAGLVLTNFGHAVRVRRQALGMSQAELAYAAGLHPTYVSGIERGLRNVALINIVSLAKALSVEPGRLLGTAG